MKSFRTKELYADLYENDGKPLVVIIGGSRGGIWSIAESFLDSLKRNYSVLILAYFGVGELPKTLKEIPLEYFINGIEKVKIMLHLKDRDILVIGNSKGGEAALLLISKGMNPAATVACVPSCYVWQGIPTGPGDFIFPKSSWTYNGKPLPFIKMKFNWRIIKDIRNKIYNSCYNKSIEENKNEKAIIDLSGYKGKLLLLSSDKDVYWPSKTMCDFITAHYKIDVTHKVLSLSGHYFQEYEESIKETERFLAQVERAS